MKVKELTAYVVRIPLRNPMKHASHERSETDNLILRCVLDDGTEGFGEGVPREYVTGETVDVALDLLRRADLARQLEACADFPAALALAERVRPAPVPGDDRGRQGNSARCALELALLDACGRRFGEPLSTVTRLLAPDLYKPVERVRYSGAIMSANSNYKIFLSCLRLRVYGFHQVKIKVGIAGQDDVRRLRKMRWQMGRNMDLRVDANEGWKPGHVVNRINDLEPFGITSVEQPVPHAEVGALADARKHVNVPIMLDESLCSPADAERAREQGLCDLFNLRLSKCGGFIPCLRLAQFAKKHGLGYQLGCQIGESALLSAAGRHFATTVADIRYLEGSYDKFLVREALGDRDISFGWGAWAPALTGPGLGVGIDREALARVTLRQEQLLS